MVLAVLVVLLVLAVLVDGVWQPMYAIDNVPWQNEKPDAWHVPKVGGGELQQQGMGGNPPAEEWCGPFSVARQMIAQREEARRLREVELEQRDENANAAGHAHHPLDQIH